MRASLPSVMTIRRTDSATMPAPDGISNRPFWIEMLLRKSAAGKARASTGSTRLADVVGFNPTEWTLLRFRLWREPPAALAGDAQLYKVGHLSLP